MVVVKQAVKPTAALPALPAASVARTVSVWASSASVGRFEALLQANFTMGAHPAHAY